MKKGSSMIWSVLVVFVVFGFFFYIFASNILSEDGSVKRAAGEVSDAVQKVSGVGDDEINRISLPSTPKEVQEGFNSLIRALNTQSNNPCIREYGQKNDKGGFSDMKGYTIEFLRYSEAANEPQFTARLLVPAPDGRIADIQYVNKDVCVVGGEVDTIAFSAAYQKKMQDTNVKYPFKDYFPKLGLQPSSLVAQNFYNNWIASKRVPVEDGKAYVDYGHAQWFDPDYSSLRTLKITGAQSMEFVTSDEKKYSTGKEDGGLLYVAESGKVCVFATFDSYLYDGNFDEKGLHNSQISSINLRECSS
jgi:hypothetical protein